jgi:hypothetical protein
LVPSAASCSASRGPHRPAGTADRKGTQTGAVMKKFIEIVCCILHPIAVVLIWINLLTRRDIGLIAKLTWGITAIVPLVPFVYVLTGNDFI